MKKPIHLLFFFLFCSLGSLWGQSLTHSSRQKNAGLESWLNPCQAPFYHGVASGDPLSDGFIIWTRISRSDTSFTPIPVDYEVADDSSFSNVIANGSVTADTSSDYCVKIDIRGLQEGTYYYYRFKAQGVTSMAGRSKTAPLGQVNRARLGVVSCSDYRRGFFQAYQNLADRNDLDLILHLGDYIYEGSGGPQGRQHEPNAEIYRLQDYRQRYSQYHLDSMLQRCHQVHPFVNIWDDHDIVVDALRDTSYRHNGAFGPYSWRKFAAIRAAREWLPIRDPDSLSSNYYKNWRKLPYGDLLEVIMLDARLYDRDKFADDTQDSLYGSPNHKIVGPEQMNWLKSSLSASTARWKVLGNQVMLSHFTAGGQPLVLENWDGYPVERGQLYDHLDSATIENVVVVTGDFHCGFANDVPRDPLNFNDYNPFNGNGSLCVEFVVPSVTGDNFDEGNDFGLGTSNAGVAQNLIQVGNPHTKYVDLTSHGYLLLDLDDNRCQAEFYGLDDISDPQNTGETLLASWQSEDESQKLSNGSAASQPKPGVPPAPKAPCKLVNRSEAQTQQVLSIFPNPASDFIWVNVVLLKSQKLDIKVISLQGSALLQLPSRSLSPGNYTIELDLSSLPVGLYLLQMGERVYRVQKAY